VQFATGVVDNGGKFAAGIVATSINDPNVIFRGFVEDDSWKKT
jgi:hypothetical protein